MDINLIYIFTKKSSSHVELHLNANKQKESSTIYTNKQGILNIHLFLTLNKYTLSEICKTKI